MTSARTILCAVLVCALGGIPYASLHALSLTNERPLVLTLTPESPSPGDAVHMTVQSYAIDLDRSTVTWRVNDIVIAEGFGLKEANIEAGALGERTTVVVSVIDNEENRAEARATIIPSEIDLVWNSDSYAPPFYKGRTLAGTNAVIHAHALVRFVTPAGVRVPDADIIYTWKRNGTVLATVSGRGKSSATFAGPALHASDTISVDAETVERSHHDSATARLPATDAILMLYENHPLFGILFHRAIVGDVNTNEREQKVTAIPFFARIQSPGDASLIYEWRVNDASIAASESEPQTLTITANDYTGPADISLSVMNTADYVMRATGVWRLIFGENSGIFFGNDPFGQ